MLEHTFITQPDQLHELCDSLQKAKQIALDTEFVPEYTYQPALCLLQVATDRELAAIDAVVLKDLDEFWRALLRPGCEIVVHAGKEEMNFCLSKGGTVPEHVTDVQLAAGLVGLGYPSSYSNLAQKILQVRTKATETRTDWRKRPLSARQVDYAIEDVKHLLAMRDRLTRMLKEQGRDDWFEEEMTHYLSRIQNSETGRRWRRAPGAGKLSSREMAVLQELTRWREERARKLDKPLGWILRNDLLAELAKRQPTTLASLEKSRGVGNLSKARWASELLEAVQAGLNIPDSECPVQTHRRETSAEQMINKVLSAAMVHLARTHNVANMLLGTSEDLKAFIRWRSAGEPTDDVPRLARGWRAQICGNNLTDLLEGKLIIRIRTDAGEPHLVFEPRPH